MIAGPCSPCRAMEGGIVSVVVWLGGHSVPSFFDGEYGVPCFVEGLIGWPAG